jgi:hypothetical protein
MAHVTALRNGLSWGTCVGSSSGISDRSQRDRGIGSCPDAVLGTNGFRAGFGGIMLVCLSK